MRELDLELQDLAKRLGRIEDEQRGTTLDLIRVCNKVRQDVINREEARRGTSKRTLSK
jgi:hypothetical protein